MHNFITRMSDNIEQWLTTGGRIVFQQYFGFALVVTLSAQFFLFDMFLPPSQWNYLNILSIIVAFMTARLTFQVPQVVQTTIWRLIHCGTLTLSPDKLPEFMQELNTRAAFWGHWFGIGALITSVFQLKLILGLNIFDAGYRFNVGHGLFFLFAALLNYTMGRFFGHMIVYGLLRRFFRHKQVSLQLQPGHLDGVAGFKPLGALYFSQAMIIAIPALYWTAWFFVLPLFPPQYAQWRTFFLSLLPAFVVLEFLAFLLPVWSFHQEMHSQKQEFLQEADRLSLQAAGLQQQLAKAMTDQERKPLKEQLAALAERYVLLEAIPTWPVDATIRRRFTVSNLVLFLPILSQILRLSDTWQKMLKVIQNILAG